MKTRTIKNLDVAGFTLIEVMITVAIIAILAAVALPAYSDYVTRSRLVEAKTSLVDMRTRLEQYFLDNRAFPDGCTASGGTADPKKIFLPPDFTTDPKNKFFEIKCPTLTANTYTVQATGKASMTGFVFTIDQANLRQTTGVKSGWTAPSPNTCWVGRKSGEC